MSNMTSRDVINKHLYHIRYYLYVSLAIVIAAIALLVYFKPATVSIAYDTADRCSGFGTNVIVTITNYHFRPLASSVIIVRAYKKGFSKNLFTTREKKGIAFKQTRIIEPFRSTAFCKTFNDYVYLENPDKLVWSGEIAYKNYGYPY